MTKRAVVVGVDDYTVLDPTGQTNLTQCVGDARRMYYILRDTFGFTDIRHFEDRYASRSRVLSALEYLLSISEAGDVVCFYFSGHGTRRPATDSADCDRFYEALVTHSGAPITDFDLTELTNNLEPDYVNFTVITDACHSGGLHRSDTSVKCPALYTDLFELMINNLQSIIPCGICMPLDSLALDNNVSNVRIGDDGTIDLDPDPSKAFVAATKSTLLSACRYDELAYLGTRSSHSIFTQALVDLYGQQSRADSYTDLLDELHASVSGKMSTEHPGKHMTPQLFGQRNRMREIFLEGWTETPSRP